MKKLSVIVYLLATTTGFSQSTIGLLEYQNPVTDGYVLFTGVSSKKTYLIDKCGEQIQEWTSNYRPGLSVDLLPNGQLFRTGLSTSSYFGSGGGKGGILELYDWNGALTWSYQLSDSNQCQHHDAIVLPNGNVLAIVWDRKTMQEATQAGKDPAITSNLSNQEVWSEKIVEIQPIGINGAAIVWEWKAWDHLVQDFDISKDNFGIVQQQPQLIDVNYVVQGPPTNPDWLHINSVDYNPSSDEIILSNHNFSEVWIIDHSTTTAQAASHSGGNSGKGGDLLYRWGNPITYDRGSSNDQKLFKQHHATIIKPGVPNEGKLLVFNNGVNRPNGNFSSVDMIDITAAGYPYAISLNDPYLPADNFWSYQASVPTSFYAQNISGVYPLENGSFFVTDGPQGRFFEFDANGVKRWEYVNPTNNIGVMNQGDLPTQNTVFRAVHYTPDFPGFTGHDLLATGPIELNPASPTLCEIADLVVKEEMQLNVFPNPIMDGEKLMISHSIEGPIRIILLDQLGKKQLEERFASSDKNIEMSLSDLHAGVFHLIIEASGEVRMIRVVKL